MSTNAPVHGYEQRVRDVPRDPLRPPGEVMRLPRMGAMHATRISFMRSLTRRMAREGWQIRCRRFDISAEQTGEAVYTVDTPRGRYSFVVFAHDIPDEDRTDRVIAERWDYTFALVLDEPDDEHLDDLRANVPLQEAGRMRPDDIVLSRGNKSTRLFTHVVDALAAGAQPDPRKVDEVGYLMRTTAVYGNGKFGLADYEQVRRNTAFTQPFSAQMLTVYLARLFSLDLVEHVARQRGPDTAVELDLKLRRAFGVGNATGLGMAPFLVNHPKIIHGWAWARETALARVKAVPTAEPWRVARFRRLFERAMAHAEQWETADERQMADVRTLRDELRTVYDELFPDDGEGALAVDHPWRWLARSLAERFSLETQEMVHSLMIEPYGELVDELEDRLTCDDELWLEPGMRLFTLKDLLERHYSWAISLDYTDERNQHYFWYRAEAKEEPRIGERGCESGAEREMLIGVGREAARLYAALAKLDDAALSETVAVFLMRRPDLRAISRRVQTMAHAPYGEIRDNLLGADIRPIDLLRFKLSVFGAVRFDPKSDRWIRITMFKGAPLPDDLTGCDACGAPPHCLECPPDDWVFPVAPEAL